MLLVLGLGAHGHDDLTDVHAGHRAQGLAEGTTHPCLEPTQEVSGVSKTMEHRAHIDEPVTDASLNCLVGTASNAPNQTH